MLQNGISIVFYILFSLLGLMHIRGIWTYAKENPGENMSNDISVFFIVTLAIIQILPGINMLACFTRIGIFAKLTPQKAMFKEHYPIGAPTTYHGYPNKTLKAPLFYLSYWPNKIERFFAWCISVFITTAYKMARALAFMRRNKEN